MHLFARSAAALFSLTVFGSTCPLAARTAETERAWRVVEGPTIQKTFADRELGDGTHYAYSFRSDGSFTGYEMGKDIRGTWRSTEREMCWTWIKPRGAEECYEVHRLGNDIRLFRHGYEALSGSLKPLRPTPRK